MFLKDMDFLKDKKFYAVAFFAPLIMCILMLAVDGVYPFGENCMLHVDMYHQYEPFFTELADKLKNGGSLLYSWRLGLGSDFVSLITYYLASPLNIFILFCPQDHIIEFMTIIILLKMCIMNVNFCIYARYHFKTEAPAVLIFALFYTFSGYMAAYNWDIMWLDDIMLFPIILLGLEKLIQENKPYLYCISLGLAVFSNFYIAFMICIFVCIWFVKVGDFKPAKILRFALYSCIGAGFGGILIVPEAITLSYSGSSGFSFPESVENYFTVVSEITRQCFMVESYTGRDHWPNLYCGIGVLILAILYFFNKDISRKDKIANAMIIAFFLVSFMNNILDFVWHGLHFPDSLPARQSFMYIFLLLLMGLEAFLKRNSIKGMHYLYAFVVCSGFILLCIIFGEDASVDKTSVVLTALIMAGYFMLFFCLDSGKKKEERPFLVLLGVMAVVECFANFEVTGFSTVSRSDYTNDWDAVSELLDTVSESDSSFYRVEKSERKTKNDSMVDGYRSATIFSSMMNLNVGTLYKYFGMEAGKNFYCENGATPLTDALLSVKYIVSDDLVSDTALRKLVAEDDGYYLYENSYTLPIGFTIPYTLEDDWDPDKTTPIENINSFVRLVGAEGNLLRPVADSAITDKGSTVFKALDDGYYYATYDDKSITSLSVKKDDSTRKYSKPDHGYILDFGYCKAGDTVEVTFNNVDTLPVNVYKLDMDIMENVYSILSRHTLENIEYTDTSVSGDITVDEGEELLLSIPYEAGWTLYVDGEECEKDSFENALIKVKLSSGAHAICLKYFSAGLKQGILITCSAMAILLATLVVRRINYIKKYQSTN